MTVWVIENAKGQLFAIYASREKAEQAALPSDSVVRRVVIGA